jgi:hypothetical protein
MSGGNRQRLDRWIRRQAFGDSGRLTGFVIKHSGQGTKGSLVGEHKVEGLTTDDISECVDSLLNLIADDAAGMGGIQRYLIESRHDESGDASARFSLRIEGYDPDLDNLDSDDAEPPTKQGALAQQMRHNEVIMKSLVAGMGGAVQSLQRSCSRQAEMIETLMEQRFKDFATVEEALSRKHERELEMLEKSSDMDRKDRLIEKGLTLLPAVVNRLTGQKMVEDAASPREEMLRSLVETLTQEQLNQVARCLRPDQQIVLLEMIKAFQDRASNGAS